MKEGESSKKKMVGLRLEDDLWIWDEANGESLKKMTVEKANWR